MKMNKKYFRIGAIAFCVLLLCNIVTLILSLTNACEETQEREKRSGGYACFMKSNLNLSDQQANAFDSIRIQYRHQAKAWDARLKENQRHLLLMISKENADTVLVRNIENEIVAIQKSLLQITLLQYKEYRALLDSVQQEKLETIYLEMFGCPDDCHSNGNCPYSSKSSQ